MTNVVGVAEIVFQLTLLATFAAAFLARRHSGLRSDSGLADRSLNRWMVGLSAGTTANSGFIVTAAVGLGYAYGLQWVMLPLSWLLGDLLYWQVFPARINRFGHETGTTTLSQMLKHGLSGRLATALSVLCAVVVVVCLAGYTAAQWLAGQKFLGGAFRMPDYAALSLFSLVIIAYSSIGGFRGSVYADTVQAVIRIIGTVIALAAVAMFAWEDSGGFMQGIAAAGDDFLSPFPAGPLAGLGFVGGFAAAAIGFGLGQPQIVSRYLAGSSPEETQAAKWIYLGFVQFTWISMTCFGLLLRGVMPNIEDPEAGLSLFFRNNINAVATGIIVADVFATIAATSNGLLVAISQAITHDLLPGFFKQRRTIPFAVVTVLVGLATMALSVAIHGTVVTLALSSVSLMGAGLAVAVMVKVLRWNHSALSLTCSVAVGLLAAIVWKYSGLATHFNEAGIGIMSGLAVNWLVARWSASAAPAGLEVASRAGR